MFELVGALLPPPRWLFWLPVRLRGKGSGIWMCVAGRARSIVYGFVRLGVYFWFVRQGSFRIEIFFAKLVDEGVLNCNYCCARLCVYFFPIVCFVCKI